MFAKQNGWACITRVWSPAKFPPAFTDLTTFSSSSFYTYPLIFPPSRQFWDRRRWKSGLSIVIWDCGRWKSGPCLQGIFSAGGCRREMYRLWYRTTMSLLYQQNLHRFIQISKFMIYNVSHSQLRLSTLITFTNYSTGEILKIIISNWPPSSVVLIFANVKNPG